MGTDLPLIVHKGDSQSGCFTLKSQNNVNTQSAVEALELQLEINKTNRQNSPTRNYAFGALKSNNTGDSNEADRP